MLTRLLAFAMRVSDSDQIAPATAQQIPKLDPSTEDAARALSSALQTKKNVAACVHSLCLAITRQNITVDGSHHYNYAMHFFLQLSAITHDSYKPPRTLRRDFCMLIWDFRAVEFWQMYSEAQKPNSDLEA
jgi:hypothetical protein